MNYTKPKVSVKSFHNISSRCQKKDIPQSIGYQKPAIVTSEKGRITYGCPQASEKDCGAGYRK
ncbi:hypothetical protein ES705_27423 [subsurface metagenome]